MLQLNNVKSGYSTGVINSNFQAIEDYINNYILNRDGVVPGEANQMNVHLDMNSKDILNVGRMNANRISLGGIPIKELLDNTVEGATQEANRAKQEADRAKQEADRAEAAVPGSGGIESIVAGSGISVDDSDPANPIVSATGGGSGGGVESIVAGDGISVDNSDPTNPVISATGSAGTEVNVQTGAAYTLVLSDAFKMVVMNNAGANTITVPPNSAVAFPVNTRIDLGQDGVGQTTIVAGAGVTIRTPDTLKLRKQWSKASLIRRAANVWDLVGDLEVEV